jgi:hypothetical protein
MQKKRYHVRNWKDYNEALVKRGYLNFWFDEEVIRQWHVIENTGKRGRPKVYSDIAVQCALTIREVFHLPLRATEGLIRSLIGWGNLSIQAPDYSTLCLRQKNLAVCLPKTTKKKPLHAVVDSTGLKVFGEGEWKVRQYGYNKRRTWRKLHLAIDANNQEIEAAVVTTNDFKDSEVLPDLLDQIDVELSQVSGDGGYDSHESYQLIANRGADPVIPPRKDAVIAQHGNFHLPANPRDEVIRKIRQLGRKNWKKQSGYHKRSLAETAMYRLKTIFGGALRARLFENQGTETLLRCSALNKMTQLGMPISYAVI